LSFLLYFYILIADLLPAGRAGVHWGQVPLTSRA
jgi:hypothetical protein